MLAEPILGRDAPSQEIAADLRREIQNGKLRPGSRLPSTRELAIALKVARNTVVAAYKILSEEGAIRSSALGPIVCSTDAVRQGRRDMLDEHLAMFEATLERRGFPKSEVHEAYVRALGAPEQRS